MTSQQNEKELRTAVKAGDEKTVRRLLETDVDFEARDPDKRTPLMLAARSNHVEIAKMLIEKGANVNAQDNISDSPFLYSGANGYLEIVRLCLSHGADFNIFNRFGGTALIPAAEKGHPEMVAELVKIKNFPIDHVNKLGWTAVLETVILTNGSAKFVKILKTLVDGGCNVNIPDHDGVKALTHAKNKGYTDMIKILESAGATE